jgi:hypothetical protein
MLDDDGFPTFNINLNSTVKVASNMIVEENKSNKGSNVIADSTISDQSAIVGDIMDL